jgi:hypothetical protein
MGLGKPNHGPLTPSVEGTNPAASTKDLRPIPQLARSGDGHVEEVGEFGGRVTVLTIALMFLGTRPTLAGYG